MIGDFAAISSRRISFSTYFYAVGSFLFAAVLAARNIGSLVDLHIGDRTLGGRTLGRPVRSERQKVQSATPNVGPVERETLFVFGL